MKPITLGKISGKTYAKSQSLNLDLLRLIETRLLVTASSGGGKSYALRRIIEQAYGKIQIVILDVEGEFSTLRPSHDFVILGKGGDVDLVPQHAATYAHKFLELRRDVVVDLFELEPQQRKAFVRDFLRAMVDARRELWHEVLVILDEAHEFAPEKSPAISSEAVISMASKGRKRGFALLMATQRLAKLSKDAAAECQNKLVGLANLPDDRKRGAEELGFSSREDILTLRDMEQGEFYACGPAFKLHSGAPLKGVSLAQAALPSTRPPKRGTYKAQAPATSAKLRKVLETLKELPKEAVQELQDKAALKARIKELEIQLKTKPVELKVPLLDENRINKKLQEAHERGRAQGQAQGAEMALGRIKLVLAGLDKELGEGVAKLQAVTKKHIPPYQPSADMKQLVLQSPKPASTQATGSVVTSEGVKLLAVERAILSFLGARRATYFSPKQVAAMTGYAYKGGGFVNGLSHLHTLGLIGRNSSGVFVSINQQLPDLGSETPSTLADWVKRLAKAERTVYEALLEDPAQSWPLSALAERGGYAEKGGGFVNAISRLCTLGLAVRPAKGQLQLNPDLKQFL